MHGRAWHVCCDCMLYKPRIQLSMSSSPSISEYALSFLSIVKAGPKGSLQSIISLRYMLRCPVVVKAEGDLVTGALLSHCCCWHALQH